MFESLKKKFSSWLKKDEKGPEEPEKKKKIVGKVEDREEVKEIKKKVLKAREKAREGKEADEKEKKVIEKEEVKEAEADEKEKKVIEKEEQISVKDSSVESGSAVVLKGDAKEVGKTVEHESSEQDLEITEGGEEEKKPVGGEAEEEKTGFFGRLKDKLVKSELKVGDFDGFFDEFEDVLLEHNVALEVVDKIRENLRGDLVGKQFGRREVESEVREALRSAIGSVLVEGEDVVEKIKSDGKKPFVVLFFGINGSGKTTSVAKLAYLLKEKGLKVVLGAADTFRAASIEQLEKHGKKIGVPVVSKEYGSDPASVAFDAIARGKKEKADVVLIDTAGRMYTKSNLMREMEKIVKVADADLKIFVGEAISGNDVVEQAKMFAETAGIDGSILTKADVDEKAGAVLSVGFVTGKPILFLGVGQEYSDLERFSREKVLAGLGLGD